MSDLSASYPVTLVLAIAWGDMDALAHVNNVVYFRWFESARVAYFGRVGLIDWTGEGVAGPILAAASCRYRAPLTYPDKVTVGARTVRLGRDRFVMGYAVASERLGRVAAEGEGTVVTYDFAAGRKVAMPAPLRQAILDLEASVGHRPVDEESRDRS